MPFYADTMIFNGIPSELYNLYLGEVNDSGEASTETSQDISLLTNKLFRRPVPLFWGAESTPVLTFPLIFKEFQELRNSRSRLSFILGIIYILEIICTYYSIKSKKTKSYDFNVKGLKFVSLS